MCSGVFNFVLFIDHCVSKEEVETELQNMQEKFQYSGNNRISMHMVRLRITLFDENDQQMRDVPPVITDMIVNKNEPLTAPLELIWIMPEYFCSKGGHFILFGVKCDLINNQDNKFLEAEIRNKVSKFWNKKFNKITGFNY